MRHFIWACSFSWKWDRVLRMLSSFHWMYEYNVGKGIRVNNIIQVCMRMWSMKERVFDNTVANINAGHIMSECDDLAEKHP